MHPDNNGFIVSWLNLCRILFFFFLTENQDAAAAALFTACKIEDTLKKSKEILCAAYNLKLTPAEQVTPDDAVSGPRFSTKIGEAKSA